MNNLQQYQQQASLQGFVDSEPSERSDGDFIENVIMPLARRWRIVLSVVFLICAIGIPTIWHLIKPSYSATAAIRVAPIIPSILFSDTDSVGVKPMYSSFMNTQADLMTSNKVLERVADDLAEKNLPFFQKSVNPVAALKQAVIHGRLFVRPDRHSELIKITMQSENPKTAEQIVNAMVRAYMATEVSNSTMGGDHKLTVLENERKTLTEKLQRQHQAIRQMAEEYGSVVLTGRQDIMLQRVARFETELAKVQARKIALQSRIKLLETTKPETVGPDKLLKMRQGFINADLTMKALTGNIVQLEQALIIARQTLAPTNPELERRANLLQALKERLGQRQKELEKSFDDMTSKEFARTDKDQLAGVQAELVQLAAQEKRFEEMLKKENAQTIELGRKHLAIQDFQDQFKLTKELYDSVRRRIMELEMERKRPGRISVAYYADVIPAPNKRIKYTAALVLAALACGMSLAFLRDKVDTSLRSPDDFVKHVGVRIIGTTARTDRVEKSLRPQQVVDDYQTICANIELLSNEGIPAKLVVTSATVREGKTTFSINLATSLARSGKKVLLIDGDLRKPDIGHFLGIAENPVGPERALADVRTFEKLVYPMPVTGLHVLTTQAHNPSDTFKILEQLHANHVLDRISQNYDHVIIDTPPVLAVPDALLWAKMANAVVLTSFAGYTTSPDLKEALERLKKINARALGTVLNNVQLDYSYNRYSRDYYSGDHSARHTRTRRNGCRNKNKCLLLPVQEHKDTVNPVNC